MMARYRKAIAIIIALASIVVLSYGLSHLAPSKSMPLAAASLPERYTCPMHPNIVQTGTGTCPICNMALVKLSDGSTSSHSNLVHVDASTQQRMGVRLEVIQERDLHRSIKAFATIAPDASRTISVSAKIEGWIKRLHLQGVGQRIRAGQLLYEVYSPELEQKQRDYVGLLTRLDSLRGNSSSMEATSPGPNSAMIGSLAKERFRARRRLLAADIPEDVLDTLEKERRPLDVMPVRATQGGIVTSISVNEGRYINPMQPILIYTDQSQVWAEVTLYPDQIAWVNNGDTIKISSSLAKTTTFESHIDLYTLQIDPGSRTARLRLPLANASGSFVAGGYADVVIESSPRRALSIPRDALIRTGHGQFVVVSEGDGHFRSASVETGIEDDSFIEIVSGLTPGMEIAVNGQFLLDAASSIQAMQSRMALTRSPADQTPDQKDTHP
jgi:Cu(I)/Ag(I) efflux system membrane fusion protein